MSEDRLSASTTTLPARGHVAAVRTALRHMSLTAKRHAAGTAVAAFDMDAYFIDEHGCTSISIRASEGRNGLLA